MAKKQDQKPTTTKSKIERLVRKGRVITGEVVGGAAIGALFGGEAGAAAGALVPVAVAGVKKVLADIARRTLSTRETARVGAAVSYAAQRIAERLAAGEKLRNDGFFDPRQGDRSTAEELFEATLLKCKNEAQEKKCRYIANVFANAAFMRELKPDTATYILQRAEQLTYRQLCLIALVARASELSSIHDRPWGRVIGAWREHPDQAIIAEVKDLGDLYLIDATGNTEEKPSLYEFGETLFAAMGLNEIPRKDLAAAGDAFFWRLIEPGPPSNRPPPLVVGR